MFRRKETVRFLRACGVKPIVHLFVPNKREPIIVTTHSCIILIERGGRIDMKFWENMVEFGNDEEFID